MENQIDLSYIQEVACGDQQMVKELISDIIELMEETEKVFPGLLQLKDFSGIAKAAHKLKAPIQMVGAAILYEKIEQLETTAMNSSYLADIIPIYNSFEAMSQSCRESLENIINNKNRLP